MTPDDTTAMSERPLFHTSGGIAVPALSRAEMVEVDRVAVEETGPTLLQMMEHAGQALCESAFEMLGDEWRGARVAILAGPGGNGGGGICAGRHLANRGVDALVVTSRPPTQARGAAVEQLRTLAEGPARLVAWSDAFDLGDVDLVIDAVIGYSLEAAPTGPLMALIRAANASPAPTLSLDLPSGIDADSGEAPGVAVQATRTMTLALPKRGLRRDNAGELAVADLGIPPGVFARAGVAFQPFFGPHSVVPLRYPGEA